MTKAPVGPAAKAGRILVVEDSPSARRLLQEVLLRLGVELPNLRVAGSVVEALTLFTQWRPKVAFIDIELRAPPVPPTPSELTRPAPETPKDGAELANLILSRDPAVKVILCSASDPSNPRVAQLVREKKAEFIMKPLIAARVEEVLARVVPPGPTRSPWDDDTHGNRATGPPSI